MLFMLDLRQLRTLATIARTGSYAAAAETLGYTQSAVSYQMRRLQHEAGTPLVVQAGRGVQLTQAGMALVMHAETALAALQAAQEELGGLAAHSGAVVRITGFQSSCATFVPRVVGYLRRRGSGVRITIDQAEPAEARARIRSGKADLGLLAKWENEPLPAGEEAMRRIPLITERRCVVMPRDHPLAALPEIEFAQLADEQWVMEGARDRFMAACLSAGFTPQIAATVDDQFTIQQLVAAGVGVTLMNELALWPYMDVRLVAHPLQNWPLRSTYVLLWPDMATVPSVARVLRAIQATAAELREALSSPHAAAAGVDGPADV